MEYYFDKHEPEYAEKWIHDYCGHVVGALRGKPAKLEKFQRKILEQSLGWKIKETDDYKYSTIYTFIPRGNAKSTTAQWFGMYKAFGAGIQAARSYTFASSKDQAAGALFQPVKDMVLSHPVLSSEFLTYHNHVKDPHTDSIYKLMSAEWRNAHSLIPSDVDVDELHLQVDSKLLDGINSGKAKRTDCTPQVRIWTTAGEINTFAHSIHKYAMMVHDGIAQDDSFLPIIYGAHEDDDPFDPEVWAKVNPGWNFINQREFRELAKRAEREPSFLNTFKRYNLNMWTGSSEAWIPGHEWSLGNGIINYDSLKTKMAFGGLYVSSVRDLISFCVFVPDYKCFVWWYWCPKTESNRRRDQIPGYSKWVDDGYIKEVLGNTIEDEVVINEVIEVSNHLNLKNVTYHRAEATSKVLALQDNGIEIVPFSITSYGNMSAPSKELEKRMIEGKIKHGENPVSKYQIECTQLVRKEDMIRPSAEHSKDNICGVYACIMALSGYMVWEEEQKSVYESRGIRVM